MLYEVANVVMKPIFHQLTNAVKQRRRDIALRKAWHDEHNALSGKFGTLAKLDRGGKVGTR